MNENERENCFSTELSCVDLLKKLANFIQRCLMKFMLTKNQEEIFIRQQKFEKLFVTFEGEYVFDFIRLDLFI